jgi:hypothetical protein
MRTLIKHTKHGFKHKPYHVAFLGVLFVASLMVLGIVTHTISSFAAGSPPINTSRPAISGTAAVGQVLTTDEGIWTGLPTYDYQWRSCDSAGNNCSDISGANGSSYTLQASDAGNTVRAVVTATNVDGSDFSTSDASGVIQAQLGDLNNDGIINLFDLGIFLGHWQSGSSPIEDFVANGIIDQADLNVLLGLYQP